MKTSHLSTSACRLCRFYTPEGRRGGVCQRLSTPVQSSWKACSLALPPFAPSWEELEEMALWSSDALVLGHSRKVDAVPIGAAEPTLAAVPDPRFSTTLLAS